MEMYPQALIKLRPESSLAHFSLHYILQSINDAMILKRNKYQFPYFWKKTSVFDILLVGIIFYLVNN